MKLKAYSYIALVGILMLAGVFAKFAQDIVSSRANFIQEEHYKAREVASHIEEIFKSVYEGLRIISRLPGVRETNRYGRNMDPNAKKAIQEIYRSISDQVSLSEIYVVPLDFNPDRKDDVTGRLEEPILVFDGKIRGKGFAEEVEIHEYRLMAGQMARLSREFTNEPFDPKETTPAISGPEVLTCDSTRMDPKNPTDADRAGLVYTLPLYNEMGRLKGGVCGVILSSVLRDALVSNSYILANGRYAYRLKRKGAPDDASQEWVQREMPDPDKIHSEVMRLDVRDEGNAWYLWVGIENSVFWQRNDVKIATQFAWFGAGVALLLTSSMALGYHLVRKNGVRLEMINRDLLHHQQMLENSRNTIKSFSGKMLSIREEEMKKLGRELHDMVGGMAVSLNAKFAVAARDIQRGNGQQASQSVQQAKVLLDSIVGDFKRIAVSLRPPQLEATGLIGALTEYCAKVAGPGSLNIVLDSHIDDRQLSAEISIALYRVVQESLNNIIKHACANNVTVQLTEQNGSLDLSITDDGVGFDATSIGKPSETFKVGILGMRERIESFRGTFSIDSAPFKGTRVLASIPRGAHLITEQGLS